MVIFYGKVLGTIFGDLDRISLVFIVWIEQGALRRLFYRFFNRKLKLILLGHSLGYTDGKMLGSDEGINLGLFDGKVLGTVLGNVDRMTWNILILKCLALLKA